MKTYVVIQEVQDYWDGNLEHYHTTRLFTTNCLQKAEQVLVYFDREFDLCSAGIDTLIKFDDCFEHSFYIEEEELVE